MKLEYILKTMIMNTKILCVWIALLTCQIAGAQTKNVTWGDQGNGVYQSDIECGLFRSGCHQGRR